MKKINVLIVDDSAVVRQVMNDVLSSDPSINVIGCAPDPIFAMRRMETNWPDVIVLDVEMPRMDGITFLKKIMAERPTPVVICSTLTEKSADTTMHAMSAGAVDIIAKPKAGLKDFLREERALLINAVKAASHAKPAKGKPFKEPVRIKHAPAKLNADVILPPGRNNSLGTTTESIVAIGTSTGGTQALEHVLKSLPRVSPGIAVVQHMPEKFTKAFADRLNSLAAVEVREARDGDRLIPGLVLIAPGGRHMVLKRSGAQYHVNVVDGPVVNRHRPSVDVLFRSAASCAGKNALGIIMTGMGDDGSAGLLEMHQAGARTLAQDEQSCVVFGMPKEAIKRGAVDDVVPLNAIAEHIIHFGQRSEHA